MTTASQRRRAKRKAKQDRRHARRVRPAGDFPPGTVFAFDVFDEETVELLAPIINQAPPANGCVRLLPDEFAIEWEDHEGGMHRLELASVEQPSELRRAN